MRSQSTRSLRTTITNRICDVGKRIRTVGFVAVLILICGSWSAAAAVAVPGPAAAAAASVRSGTGLPDMTTIWAQERDYLQLFFESLGGKNWGFNTGWGNGSLVDAALGLPSHCLWFGIGCSGTNGRVHNISLGYNDLYGTIPKNIGVLEELIFFNVTSNEVADEIPSEFGTLRHLIVVDMSLNSLSGTIPSSLLQLSQLQFLSLLSNRFFGYFPREMNMTSLGLFTCAQNGIKGTIPTSIGLSFQLAHLDIGHNRFEGSIPTEIGLLKSLIFFDASSNYFSSASLPAEIGNMTSLAILKCARCHLSGTLPPSIGNLYNLIELHLTKNQIEGAIPSEISNCASLTTIDVSYNNFRGALPSELATLSELNTIRMSRNYLQGTIPSEWRIMRDLNILDLSVNYLSGSLPTFIRELQSLQYLFLESNSFSGSFPSEILGMPSLITCFVSDNYLNGTLPDVFNSNMNMSSIFVFRNQFTGTIPNSICSMPKLSVVGMQQNNFNGTIPACLFVHPYMQKINLGHNSLTGPLPCLPNMESPIGTVDLTGNRLSGTLCPAFNTMTSLMSISLGWNNLSGTLPSEWAVLPFITLLALTGNNLEGTLPTQWAALDSLAYLFLNSNNFNGTIPASFSAMDQLTQVLLDNNNFSGTLPSALSNWYNLHTLDLSHNQFIGTIPQFNVKQRLDLSNNLLNDTAHNLISLLGVLGPNVFDASNNPLIESPIPSARRPWYSEYEFKSTIQIISLRLSNCSIIGEVTNEFMLRSFPSLQYLDISLNRIHGPLPVTWLNEHSPIVVNITGNNFRNGPEDLVDPAADSDELSTIEFSPHTLVHYESERFMCPAILWQAPGISIVGLSASYFAFQGCRCVDGYAGTPPDCHPVDVSHAGEEGVALGIGVPLGVLIPALIISMWILYRRRVRVQRMRAAERLLGSYAGRQMSVSSDHQKNLNESLIQSNTKHSRISVDTNRLNSKVDLQALDINFRDITVLCTIAHGATASVSLGLWKGTEVVVKQFFPGSQFNFGDFFVECSIHSRLRHPNVLTLFGICRDPLSTVCEFMNRGSLFHLVRQSRLNVAQHGLRILLDVAQGMEYLHAKGLLHRDLKSLNILVNEHWHAKVCDFGASRDQSVNTMTIGVGTVAWMSPEVFDSGRYTEKCDVYSFGIIVWEVISGKVPFDEFQHGGEIMHAVRRGERPAVADDAPLELSSLMKRCWDANPDFRPPFTEIVQILSALGNRGASHHGGRPSLDNIHL